MRGREALTVLAAVTIAMAAPGCSSSEPALPAWPSGVEQASEYAFGDEVMARDGRAWAPVFDTLATRFDRDRLRVIHLALAADVAPETVRRAFDEEMVDGRAWRTVPQAARSADAWAHGYESPDGADIFVAVGLEALPGDVRVPLTVVTTLSGS